MIMDVINKPWGFEYVSYQNESIAVWVLHINKGCMTSLHCHPSKATGLILIRGTITLNFIDKSVENIQAPFFTSIQRGRFHQTHALSDDVVIIEVENPVDKNDLVRLDDLYGRENKKYEYDSINVFNIERINISDNFMSYNLFGRTFTIEHGSLELFNSKLPDDTIILLRGNVTKRIENTNHNVIIPGDIFVMSVFDRIFKNMDGFSDDSIILTIR